MGSALHPIHHFPRCTQAVSMNDSYLSDEDYSSVQSVEDIKRILSEAQTPGPNKYNFDNQVCARVLCWVFGFK
jgi:hypothetical protein